MPQARNTSQPRTFFLNETHELSTVEKGGGGRIPDYVGISWAAKARQIAQSIEHVMQTVQASRDPLKNERYFVLAQPVPDVEKRSKDKKKAPQGTFKEPIQFGASHGRVFERLGLDLIQVTEDGKAVVHAEADMVEQLRNRSAALDTLGAREQARWVTIDSFDTIPIQLRVDSDWLKALKPHDPSDIVIELQPVLTRVQADRVLRSIADLLIQREGEKLTGTGTDFSGRFWFRGKATQRSVRTIVRDFYSVQAVHSPLFSVAAAKSTGRPPSTVIRTQGVPAARKVEELPCVAVVDLGIPNNHKQLAQFRRGQFTPADAPRTPVGDHGAFVASRVVFGDCESPNELSACKGKCTFYDAIVAEYPQLSGQVNRVNDKIVMDAIRGVWGAAPDVRVFNLSFGDTRPHHEFADVERQQKRLLVQDLDNFVFASDSLVIVAAGNSAPGVSPTPDYPDHHSDARWALGPWACGYNTLVCGSYVSVLSTNGLASVGWPSPFTRVGPGFCEAPVPSFGAQGGNTDGTYAYRPGLGVWGYSGNGLPEDRTGTSQAAPILSREAAITLHSLQSYCAGGTVPFGVTVRAFLALTAARTCNDQRAEVLARRTLGNGHASSHRLDAPVAGSAVMLWQGFIESPKDIVRVQIPIPLDWLGKANVPMLRLVVCYDPPVNEAALATWACRKVKAVLHLGPDASFLRAPSGGHESYPLIIRQYNLARYAPGQEKAAEGDMWLLELSYEEIAPYPPAMDFDPRQRVAFAAELIDEHPSPVDPQPAMQALPNAAAMTRLSAQRAATRTPIIVRTRT
jgi:hypothetical protein